MNKANKASQFSKLNEFVSSFSFSYSVSFMFCNTKTNEFFFRSIVRIVKRDY